MSIWTYSHNAEDGIRIDTAVRDYDLHCTFCSTRMVHVKALPGDTSGFPDHFTERIVRCCSTCGWWVLKKDVHGRDNAGAYSFTNTYGAIGTLRPMNLQDPSTAIADVRAQLAADFSRRKTMSPKLLEETVGSIYRSHGFLNVRVVGKANDGGLDIIMEGPDDSVIGVQVKRYENKIQAEEIRAFIGALVLAGLTRGIFLTTSDYTRGALAAAARAATKNYRIELSNATQFYDALGLAQRKMYDSATDPSAPFLHAKLHHVRYKKAY